MDSYNLEGGPSMVKKELIIIELEGDDRDFEEEQEESDFEFVLYEEK